MWTALPPLSWWPVGWLAPLCWLVLIQLEKLPGRRPYVGIYSASVLFWVVTMQGIRLAHWANYLGLVAMALYLGMFLPIFVAVARVAYHRWRISLLIAAPVAWVGVEVARGYGPLGFSMALLGHTQVKQLHLIQIADLCGPYTVSLVVMFVAACVYRMLPGAPARRVWWPVVPLLAVVTLVLAYGQFRLTQVPPRSEQAPLRVALIQGSIDTVFEYNPDHPWEILEEYGDLTADACDQFQPLDVVVWPETMFPIREILIDEGKAPQLGPSMDRQLVEDTQSAFEQLLQNSVRRMNEPEGVSHSVRRPRVGCSERRFGSLVTTHRDGTTRLSWLTHKRKSSGDTTRCVR